LIVPSDASVRIQEFTSWLQKSIPVLANDTDAKSDLEKMGFPRLLTKYLNWADRFIQPRRRRLEQHNQFWDERALKCKDVIQNIVSDLTAGNDINKRISHSARIHGYISESYSKSNKKKKWLERDLYLNGHDVHHVHLGEKPSKRSDNLLFFTVGREIATLVMVGTHKSFDDGALAQRVAEIRSDKLELTGISVPIHTTSVENRAILERAGFATTYQVDEKTVIGARQMSDGSSLSHVIFAEKLCKVIRHYESELDNENTIRLWFEGAKLDVPNEPSFVWRMQGCDLNILEQQSKICITPTEGKWCR
jgi:hypothetical protein